MSEQNRYRIVPNYKDSETEEWAGWRDKHFWRKTADNWQDAIQECIDYASPAEYTVVSETPSGDGKSGITEIQFDPQQRFVVGVKIKATLIED